jgi:hypothetical protein
MAPSPQKASWRRIDTTPSPGDVGVGDVGSGAGIQPFQVPGKTNLHPNTYIAPGQQLAGQDVSSSLDEFLLPSTTFQAFSSPSIAGAYRCAFPFRLRDYNALCPITLLTSLRVLLTISSISSKSYYDKYPTSVPHQHRNVLPTS